MFGFGCSYAHYTQILVLFHYDFLVTLVPSLCMFMFANLKNIANKYCHETNDEYVNYIVIGYISHLLLMEQFTFHTSVSSQN